MKNLVRERRASAVMAIHDLNLASRFSDTLVFLDKGKIYDAGERVQVLTQENIRNIYGVEAIVSKNSGHPHIIPIAPVAANGDR